MSPFSVLFDPRRSYELLLFGCRVTTPFPRSFETRVANPLRWLLSTDRSSVGRIAQLSEPLFVSFITLRPQRVLSSASPPSLTFAFAFLKFFSFPIPTAIQKLAWSLGQPRSFKLQLLRAATSSKLRMLGRKGEEGTISTSRFISFHLFGQLSSALYSRRTSSSINLLFCGIASVHGRCRLSFVGYHRSPWVVLSL